jgi:hypothetical protein
LAGRIGQGPHQSRAAAAGVADHLVHHVAGGETVVQLVKGFGETVAHGLRLTLVVPRRQLVSFHRHRTCSFATSISART